MVLCILWKGNIKHDDIHALCTGWTNKLTTFTYKIHKHFTIFKHILTLIIQKRRCWDRTIDHNKNDTLPLHATHTGFLIGFILMKTTKMLLNGTQQAMLK